MAWSLFELVKLVPLTIMFKGRGSTSRSAPYIVLLVLSLIVLKLFWNSWDFQTRGKPSQVLHRYNFKEQLLAGQGSQDRSWQTNECDACPIFVTFGFTGKAKRTTSGIRGQARFMNSTWLFLRAVQAASHSLAHAHKGCWKLYFYSDDKVILGGAFQSLGLGPEVVLRGEVVFKGNVYDGELRNSTAVPNIMRGYQSLSRIKLDLVLEHLAAGEKVIWMDLDTMVTSDMSCIYQKLERFVIAPGYKAHQQFSPLTRYFMTKESRTPEELKVPLNGSHFVFGDLWMADNKLIEAALEVEVMLSQHNVNAEFDVQSLFSILHGRNWAGINDLVNMTDVFNRSWGYQHIAGNVIPYVKIARSKLFQVGYKNGELYSLTTCQKVGAMSWNWPSFSRFLFDPCIFMYSNDAPDWIEKVSEWGSSSIPSFKVNRCGAFARPNLYSWNCSLQGSKHNDSMNETNETSSKSANHNSLQDSEKSSSSNVTSKSSSTISISPNTTVADWFERNVTWKDTTGKGVYLLLAPHYDDCSLSLGGMISRLSQSRENHITVVTVMGGKPAVAVKRKSDRAAGFTNSDSAIDARREENMNSLSPLGLHAINLPFLDGAYENREVDDLVVQIAEKIMLIIDFLGQKGSIRVKVFGPMGFRLSYHKDHESVHKAILAAAGNLAADSKTRNAADFFFFEDFPYVLKIPSMGMSMAGREYRELLQSAHNVSLEATPWYFTEADLQRKERQIHAYLSQLKYMVSGMEQLGNFYRTRCSYLGSEVRHPFCEMTWRLVSPGLT